MKTDKEYPATHSMSTSWYIADEDGNVGIMEFNENGPVPWGLGEHCLDELLTGSNDGDGLKRRINLTDEQIFEFLGEPYPKDEIKWSFCILQIDPSRTDEFMELIKDNSEFIEECISKKLGLYEVYAYGYVSDDEEVIPGSLLDAIIKRDMILNVYDSLSRLDTNEQVDSNDNIVYSKTFDTVPYYIYKQPYWTAKLQTLLAEPKNPVKLDQLPVDLQKKVLRVPVKFKDAKSLQIARWYPTDALVGQRDVEAYGCNYFSFPISEEEEAYCISSLLAGTDKLPEELASLVGSIFSRTQAFCLYPTVVGFHNPAWEEDYSLTYDYSDITLRSIHVPYMSFYSVYKGSSYIYNEAEKQKIVQSSPLKEIFRENVDLFEYILNRFKPNLVIVDDEDFKIISSVYKTEDHLLVTPKYQGPIYMKSEVEANGEKLTELANRPYRGEYYPLVIPVDKMKKINPNLNENSDD
jgi:hypothetical protein